MSRLWETYRGALPMLYVSAAGGLLAGGILGEMEGELATVEGLLVMVPAFLAIRGSVYGALGSRLASGLHQGLIEPRLKSDPRLTSAIVAALLNGIAASIVAAIGAAAVLSIIDETTANVGHLIGIAVLGGILAGVALTVVILLVVFASFRRGLDPDNLVGPTVTTAGDVFGMASLYIATRIILAVG